MTDQPLLSKKSTANGEPYTQEKVADAPDENEYQIITPEIAENVESLLSKAQKYEYHFENLVFEGGGVKMAGHVGAIKAFERLGILKNCKRFAGTSGGAIVAALLSVGASSEQMITALECDMKYTFVDAPFGKLSILPNLLRKFGWNPGKRFHDYITGLLKELTGQESITFKQVYEKYGNELCVVATNVSTMSVEYFHPKTTPDVDVALAVKCSAALPGYVQPVKVLFDGHLEQYFMDGCLTCNFPLHVFDGWYLSMDFEDSFFCKLGKDMAKFSKFNPRTLGCVLMSAGEGDLLQGKLLSRNRRLKKNRPKTKLANKNLQKCIEFEQIQLERQATLAAGERLLESLRQVDINKDSVISFQEFQNAFKQMPKDDISILFGGDFSPEDAFKALDKAGDQTIGIEDFFNLMHKKGINFRSLVGGGNTMTFNSAGEFFGTAYNTLMNTTRMSDYKEDDIHRTVGIDTDYIQTTNFALEPADKEFLVQQGMAAAVVYFCNLIEKKEKGTLPDIYLDVLDSAACS